MLVSQIQNPTGTNGLKNLKKNDLISLKSSRSGQSICCVDGMLWVTQQGDCGDRILNAGEKLCTNLPGLVIVQALNDSQLTVCDEKKDNAAVQFPWQPSKKVSQCTAS
jgi:hypothetical protein